MCEEAKILCKYTHKNTFEHSSLILLAYSIFRLYFVVVVVRQGWTSEMRSISHIKIALGHPNDFNKIHSICGILLCCYTYMAMYRRIGHQKGLDLSVAPKCPYHLNGIDWERLPLVSGVDNYIVGQMDFPSARNQFPDSRIRFPWEMFFRLPDFQIQIQ